MIAVSLSLFLSNNDDFFFSELLSYSPFNFQYKIWYLLWFSFLIQWSFYRVNILLAMQAIILIFGNKLFYLLHYSEHKDLTDVANFLNNHFLPWSEIFLDI